MPSGRADALTYPRLCRYDVVEFARETGCNQDLVRTADELFGEGLGPSPTRAERTAQERQREREAHHKNMSAKGAETRSKASKERQDLALNLAEKLLNASPTVTYRIGELRDAVWGQLPRRADKNRTKEKPRTIEGWIKRAKDRKDVRVDRLT